ncbi:MAG TPA: response regulator [Spirochaetota bacterium]|nr:response regulator [Spirochaetota bacterium]
MASGIKVCCILTSQTQVKPLSSILLNMGIFFYNAENLTTGFQYIENNNIDFLLLDLDFSENASFNFLEELKKDEKYSSIYIIGTSLNTNEKFIKQLQQYNIISFIIKPFTPDVVKEKMEKIFEKFKEHIPERKFVRVKPDPDELIRLSLQLKNKKLITAKIVDISLGGLACEMYVSYENEELKKGSFIEHISFKVGNREIDVDALIINKKDKLIAFKFTHFYKNSYENLTRYVMKKLTV